MLANALRFGRVGTEFLRRTRLLREFVPVVNCRMMSSTMGDVEEVAETLEREFPSSLHGSARDRATAVKVWSEVPVRAEDLPEEAWFVAESTLGGGWSDLERRLVEWRVRTLSEWECVRERAYREGNLSEQLLLRASSRLRRSLNRDAREVFGDDERGFEQFVRESVLFAHAVARRDGGLSAQLQERMVPLVVRVAEEHFGEAVQAAAMLRESADLRHPATWFPKARMMRRKWIVHAGPTNSGKTYRALQALKAAKSGVYCSPLRLLALEVYETLNQAGVPTNLVTGQERKEMPTALHVSSTVEMADVERTVDVAVIDEMQLLGDVDRGWAWTRALLGIPAEEIHLCGDPAAVPLIRHLASLVGDELEVHGYDRMGPLEVEKTSLGGDYANVKAGDCVVAFSRKQIYAVRRLIERSTQLRCCVVYGSLPPETRNAQARLFNDRNSGYDVLVASDAVGMGLNLNIRRVVFSAVEKFDGRAVRPVEAPLIKQIAGRAGRASSQYKTGFVTTFSDEDLPYVSEALAMPPEPVQRAGILPSSEQLATFAERTHMLHSLDSSTPQVARLLETFHHACQLDDGFFLCNLEALQYTASLIEHVRGLSLEAMYALAAAPVGVRSQEARNLFVRAVEALSNGRYIPLEVQLPLQRGGPPKADPETLRTLEDRAAAVDLYLWLALRFPDHFTDVPKAETMRDKAVKRIEEGLTNISDVIDAEKMRQARRRAARLRARRGQNIPAVDQRANRKLRK